MNKQCAIINNDNWTVELCPNCKKPNNNNCDCMKNICLLCNKPIGNITFTICDECWDREYDELKKELKKNKMFKHYLSKLENYDLESAWIECGYNKNDDLVKGKLLIKFELKYDPNDYVQMMNEWSSELYQFLRDAIREKDKYVTDKFTYCYFVDEHYFKIGAYYERV
jgi:hypothetical protein